jgi:hypothetical protein
MKLSSNTILFIGYFFTAALWFAGFSKMLRSENVIKIVLVLAVVLAIFGVLLRNPQTKMTLGNAADTFFGPLIYILTYAFFRFTYRKKYGVEPTYNRASWYDPQEGREQNLFDLVVFIIPMVLSILVPLLLG